MKMRVNDEVDPAGIAVDRYGCALASSAAVAADPEKACRPSPRVRVIQSDRIPGAYFPKLPAAAEERVRPV